MEHLDSVLEAVRAGNAAYPDDVEAAVAEAMRRILALPEFDEWKARLRNGTFARLIREALRG